MAVLIDGGMVLATTTINDKEEGKAMEAHVHELIVLHPEELGHIKACSILVRMEMAPQICACQTKRCPSVSQSLVVPVPPTLPSTCGSNEEVIVAVKIWPPLFKLICISMT